MMNIWVQQRKSELHDIREEMEIMMIFIRFV